MTTTTKAPRLSATESKRLYARAREAGLAAAEARVPTPMVVVQRANPFDDSSAIVKEYAPVMGGVCGFAWVVVRPGTSSFARWLVKQGLASKHYYGGVSIWVRDFGQSMEKKQAYATAFAKVLGEAGIDAYGDSRMD
jgi:hypothetical protein